MAVRRIKGRFVVEFEQKGSRIFRRLPPRATKAQAHELETRLRQSLIDQQLLGKVPDVLVTKAIEYWLDQVVTGRKSEVATRSHAANIVADCAGELLGGLPSCAERIRGHDLSAGTRNRRLCVLKAVAKFAWRKGWTEENLSARIQLLPEKKYQRREVTPEMAKALIDAATTPRAKALIAFSAYTGLRLGEVLKLTPESVRNGALHLTDTKNGMDRVVPILPGLEPHLAQLPFGAGWRNVYRGWERARKKAKLSIRYHDLRHMVGTALHEAGEGQRTIMDILGHKSIQTSARYIHPSQETNRAALERALTKLAPAPSKSHQKGRKGAKKAA
jgi:integrase